MLRNIALWFFITLISTGCGAHFFDKSQVPVVQVSPTNPPVISWTPSAAYAVNIYSEAQQDLSVPGDIWQKRAENYANHLHSPVMDIPLLDVGKTYKVTVRRKDPKGTGDGFSNTHHTYRGEKTFTVTAENVE